MLSGYSSLHKQVHPSVAVFNMYDTTVLNYHKVVDMIESMSAPPLEPTPLVAQCSSDPIAIAILVVSFMSSSSRGSGVNVGVSATPEA